MRRRQEPSCGYVGVGSGRRGMVCARVGLVQKYRRMEPACRYDTPGEEN